MKLRRISFKTKIILIIEAIMIIVNAFIGFFVWSQLDQKVREITREKLVAIARTTAQFIDVERHEKIREEGDEESKNYGKVHEFLKKMIKANPGVDDIYTFRKTDQENVWVYVVGGMEEIDKNNDGVIEEDEEPVGIGEEVNPLQYPPQILESFDRPIAEKEINCDKWGCWLSGYAPIYDSGGKAVAAAGVDISAQDILAFEKKAKRAILMALVALITLLPLVLFFILRLLVRPVSIIVSGLEKFSQNLGNRINVRSGDEFELIAGTFNKMAGELQGLYQGLEEKVKEKTKQLAGRVREIEQKNAEDEALLASIGEGMIAVDWNGRIVITNNQGEFMLGQKKEKIIGKEFLEAVILEDEKGNEITGPKNPIKQTLVTGKKVTSSSLYLSDTRGLRFPVNITVAPVTLDGKTIGAIAVFRDITREKEVDRAKSEFVSLASHQLLTPMSSINWYTEMLLEDRKLSGRKREKYLGKISRANQRMVELVNSLLNVSRIEMGTFSISVKPVNIKEIIESLLDELQPKIIENGVKIEKKYEAPVPDFKADAKLLRMIIQNLLSNAVKYTPAGGTVKIALRKEKNLIVIEVADTGYGIPKSEQGGIFTKLFRADNIKEKVIEGTGLGLYIVKSIVDGSGGTIGFSSEENKGTTFAVKFSAEGMKEKKGTRSLS